MLIRNTTGRRFPATLSMSSFEFVIAVQLVLVAFIFLCHVPRIPLFAGSIGASLRPQAAWRHEFEEDATCAPLMLPGSHIPVAALTAHGAPGGPIQILMPANAPEPPAQVEMDMTRTEAMMTAAYELILVGGAPGTTGRDWLARTPHAVLEVGVNEGWFAALAVKLGARALVAFDMQPACARVARCTLQLNGGGGAAVFNRYVGHGSTPVRVSNDACGPGLGLSNRLTGDVAVQPVHLGAFFSDRETATRLRLAPGFEFPLVKIDVEGFETVVLETLLPLLPRVHNILVEVFAANWLINGVSKKRALALYACLHAAGLEMVDLPRRDIDFQVPGDIDLRAIPPTRVYRSWEQWQAHFERILRKEYVHDSPCLAHLHLVDGMVC
jgi:hypothetical protein